MKERKIAGGADRPPGRSACSVWFGDGGKAPHVVSVGAIKAVLGNSFARKLTIE